MLEAYTASLLLLAAILFGVLWMALQEGDVAATLVSIVALALILTGIVIPLAYRWIRRKDDKDTGHLR